MLLGYARGKVGSLVFSRSNGQQITRMRASKVKNPQTDAQVVQRIILNTVAQAYSALQPICDHSFEGVKKGQDAMSYFMRNNIVKARAFVKEVLDGKVKDSDYSWGFVPINGTGLPLAPLTIAKGSLPTVPVYNKDTDWQYYSISQQPTAAGNGVVQFPIGSGDQTIQNANTLTYGNIIEHLGLQRGDQLTFVGLFNDGKLGLTAEWARIVLDPKNADGTDAPLDTPIIAGDQETIFAVNKPNPNNVIPEGFGFFFQAPAFNRTPEYIIAPVKAYTNTLGAAVIVSRQKADGTWMRSNTDLWVLTSLMFGNSENSVYNRTGIEQALADFRTKGINLGSEWYLNNATD